MDILGLGPDYSVALLLLIAGAFAGFVDSIVGGGDWSSDVYSSDLWLGICAGFSPDQPTTGYGTRDQ